MTTIGGVVVGVTAGDESLAALHFAMGEAVLRQVPVTVVTAWATPGPDPRVHTSRASAQGVQDSQVSLALRRREQLPVVSRIIREGDPSLILTSLSRRADMLVLGHTRADRTTRVGRTCLQQVTCPVVFIHSTTDDEPGSGQPINTSTGEVAP